MTGSLRMRIVDVGDGVLFEVVCEACGQTISHDVLNVGTDGDAIAAAAGADARAAGEHLRHCPAAAAAPGVPDGRPGPAPRTPARTAGAGGRPEPGRS